MSYFLDMHGNPDQIPDPQPTLEELEQMHAKDLQVQARFGTRFLGLWYNPESGTANCLVEAPSVDAVFYTHLAAHGQTGTVARIIEVAPSDVERFLGGSRETSSGIAISDRGTETSSSFRTILFTDLERSVEMTQAIGDARAMDVVHRHDAVLRAALDTHHGREVKHTGDGIMASFRSASDAVAASISAQRQFASISRDGSGPLNVRIGISAGEPVSEHGDLFGSAVQLAARLCARAEASQVLVSAAVRELCTSAPIHFIDCGMCELKGFQVPVHHFRVDWRSEQPGRQLEGQRR